MSGLNYKCIKCGMCCFEVEGESGSKRIPLYPEEVDKLIEIAERRGVEFQVIEDLVFPDILNNKLLVVTYKIKFNNREKCCPFYNDGIGCSVHEIKPFACQAYPLSLKNIDAFNFQISIDPLCRFVSSNYERLKIANLEKLKLIFGEEYPKAEAFFRRNRNIILKIRQLEHTKKVKIPREISIEQLNKVLKMWDRVEIRID